VDRQARFVNLTGGTARRLLPVERICVACAESLLRARASISIARINYSALLLVSYLQFHGITYPLVLVLFVFLFREFGTPQLLKFVNVKPWLHSDVT